MYSCQENTSAQEPSSVRIGSSTRPATIFIKKKTLAHMLFWQYWKTPILRNNCELLLLLVWRLQINRWKVWLEIVNMCYYERVLLIEIMKIYSSKRKFITSQLNYMVLFNSWITRLEETHLAYWFVYPFLNRTRWAMFNLFDVFSWEGCIWVC